MSEEVSIRIARLPDLEVCVSFDCTDTTASRTDQEKYQHIMAKIDCQEIYLAVTEKDNPVGYLSIDRLWPMMLPLMSWIYIAPAWRKANIARDLFNFALDDLKKRGYTRLLLSTQTDRDRVLGAFTRLNMKEIGTLQANPDENVGEVFFMMELT